MKLSQLVIVGLAGLASAAGLWAAPAPSAPASLIEVNFLEPEKFTDVRDSEMGDFARTSYLDQLREHLQRQAKYYVAPGQRLAVTFTDIDMAGEFEPWRGPRFQDIRIVKDIYPPRITLSFQLTDAEGNVLKSGKRDLRDLAFMMKITPGFRDDPLRHEKALLDDWMRSEFPRVPKS